MSVIVVLTTVDSQALAQQIAVDLVESKRAACVNIVHGVRSIYRWEGKVCDDMELLLLIKTRLEHFEAVRARIRQLHTYQCPEILALPVAESDAAFVQWLNQQTGPATDDASGEPSSP